jgi:hypothetical protein
MPHPQTPPFSLYIRLNPHSGGKKLFHDNLPKRELFKDREWFTEINYYSKKSAHVEAPLKM